MNLTTKQYLTDYDYGLNPLWQVDEIDDFTEALINGIFLPENHAENTQFFTNFHREF